MRLPIVQFLLLVLVATLVGATVVHFTRDNDYGFWFGVAVLWIGGDYIRKH